MSQQETTTEHPAPAPRLASLRLPPRAAIEGSLRRAGILGPFVVLFIVLSVASGPFFSKVNLLDILDQQASTLIIAAAGTLVLVAGGIDLSVGAIYALAGVTAAKLALSVPPAIAVLAGVALGLVVGLANGLIATVRRINSLIATLAMSFVISGLASLVTSGNLIIDYSKPGFADLARTSFLTSTPRPGSWSRSSPYSLCCCRARRRGATSTRRAATPRRLGWRGSGCTGSGC